MSKKEVIIVLISVLFFLVIINTSSATSTLDFDFCKRVCTSMAYDPSECDEKCGKLLPEINRTVSLICTVSCQRECNASCVNNCSHIIDDQLYSDCFGGCTDNCNKECSFECEGGQKMDELRQFVGASKSVNRPPSISPDEVQLSNEGDMQNQRCYDVCYPYCLKPCEGGCTEGDLRQKLDCRSDCKGKCNIECSENCGVEEKHWYEVIGIKFEFWGMLVFLITFSTAVGGWYLTTLHRREHLKFLTEIDDIYGSLKGHTRKCKVELDKIKNKIKQEYNKNKIEENHFNFLMSRIDKYLSELSKKKKR